MSAQDTDINCPSCNKTVVEKVLSVFSAKMSHADTAPMSTGCTTCSTPFRSG
jgi:hypothetical protein